MLTHTPPLPPPPPRAQHSTAIQDRLVEGLASLSMALRKRPTIRYQRNSEICQRVADGAPPPHRPTLHPPHQHIPQPPSSSAPPPPLPPPPLSAALAATPCPFALSEGADAAARRPTTHFEALRGSPPGCRPNDAAQGDIRAVCGYPTMPLHGVSRWQTIESEFPCRAHGAYCF